MVYDPKKMNCVWITPDNEAIWSKDSASHRQLVSQQNIRNMLEEEAKHMIWAEKELEMHLDLDIGYIAMKYGFIRVICYKNQFGIECIGLIEPKLLSKLSEVYQFFKTQTLANGLQLDTFIVEDFCSGEYQTFDNFSQLLNSIPD